jgi:hypothetical protein
MTKHSSFSFNTSKLTKLTNLKKTFNTATKAVKGHEDALKALHDKNTSGELKKKYNELQAASEELKKATDPTKIEEFKKKVGNHQGVYNSTLQKLIELKTVNQANKNAVNKTKIEKTKSKEELNEELGNKNENKLDPNIKNIGIHHIKNLKDKKTERNTALKEYSNNPANTGKQGSFIKAHENVQESQSKLDQLSMALRGKPSLNQALATFINLSPAQYIQYIISTNKNFRLRKGDIKSKYKGIIKDLLAKNPISPKYLSVINNVIINIFMYSGNNTQNKDNMAILNQIIDSVEPEDLPKLALIDSILDKICTMGLASNYEDILDKIDGKYGDSYASMVTICRRPATKSCSGTTTVSNGGIHHHYYGTGTNGSRSAAKKSVFSLNPPKPPKLVQTSWFQILTTTPWSMRVSQTGYNPFTTDVHMNMSNNILIIDYDTITSTRLMTSRNKLLYFDIGLYKYEIKYSGNKPSPEYYAVPIKLPVKPTLSSPIICGTIIPYESRPLKSINQTMDVKIWGKNFNISLEDGGEFQNKQYTFIRYPDENGGQRLKDYINLVRYLISIKFQTTAYGVRGLATESEINTFLNNNININCIVSDTPKSGFVEIDYTGNTIVDQFNLGTQNKNSEALTFVWPSGTPLAVPAAASASTAPAPVPTKIYYIMLKDYKPEIFD